MNKSILIGNITKDLELRVTQSNKKVVEFSIAINEGYGDKQTVEYVNIVAWEKLAENITKYCCKGSKIMVEGRIKTDSYDKNGQKVYKTYVLAGNIEFLSKKTENTSNMGGDRADSGKSLDIQPEDLPFY